MLCVFVMLVELKQPQYDNIGVNFSLYYMQIAEFSVLRRRRVLSNQVVTVNSAAYLFFTFFQAHLLYKLFVRPEASLIIVHHVFTVIIAHVVTNYRI